MTNEKIIEIIKSRMSEKRFNHSLEVAKEAKRLAEHYGEDAEKLYTAGLLHDITKETSPEEQLKYLKESAIILSDIEKSALKLWHAKSGAAYIELYLDITDREIIEAIKYHTTAKAGMTNFEKILYVADFTSADRSYKGVEGVRVAAEKSLDDAVWEGLAFTVLDLAGEGRAIHPDTFEAYNETALKRIKNR